MRPRSGQIHFAVLHRQRESTKCGKCETFGLTGTKANYETKHFREFTVDQVDVDMMGGFAIVKDGQVYDCDLKSSQIMEYIEVQGQKIPLHSIELWRKYYMLMGRDQKAAIIDQKGI